MLLSSPEKPKHKLSPDFLKAPAADCYGDRTAAGKAQTRKDPSSPHDNIHVPLLTVGAQDTAHGPDTTSGNTYLLMSSSLCMVKIATLFLFTYQVIKGTGQIISHDSAI